jgi:hypothetical protein
MLDSFFDKEDIQDVKLELHSIVAPPYCEDRGVVLALNLIDKLHHGLLSLTL